MLNSAERMHLGRRCTNSPSLTSWSASSMPLCGLPKNVSYLYLIKPCNILLNTLDFKYIAYLRLHILKRSYYALLQSLDAVSGRTKTCSYAWLFENRIIFHIIYIIIIPFSPAWHKQTDYFQVWWRPRLMKNLMCCDWLAVPVHCDWWTA